jgi:hypothetical protein
MRVSGLALRLRELDRPAVERDPFNALELLPENGGFPIDDDPAFDDPTLYLTARTDAEIRQRLLNPLGQISSIPFR